MATHEYDRPWQVMPAKIIKLALEHAEKNDEFDHQVAYLLLDIGIETALKVYLVNKNQEVEYIRFPDLLKRVREELAKSGSSLVEKMEDIRSYHNARNSLYHKGTGIGPTKDYLRRYSALAKTVIEELIGVNLKTEEKKYVLHIAGWDQPFERLIEDLEKRFAYFLESCAIITEKVRPNYATREFAMRLQYILHNWPDEEQDDPRDRVENQIHRLEKYNELTGKSVTDHDLIDYILKDINHLYMIIAYQELGDGRPSTLKQYRDFLERKHRLLTSWKQGIYSERLTVDKVRREYESIVSWMEAEQEKLDQWIESNLEDVYRDATFGFVPVL